MVIQEQPAGMLSDYRILDLTDEKGVYCGQLLGSFGADVIKIEKPGGDTLRNFGPFVQDVPHPERSLFWMAFNTNKKSITLNIESKDGQSILKKLVLTADAVIESFAPCYLDKLGLGYPELEKTNSKIILTSISPYGQKGPYSDFKASDLDCWGMGGLLASTGRTNAAPACISHVPAAYLIAGQDAACGTALALFWRKVSNQGQWVTVSIQESVVRTSWNIRENWMVTGKELQRSHDGHAVAGAKATMKKIWQAKDGYITYVLFGGRQGARQVPLLVKWMDEEGMADEYIKAINWAEWDWGSKSQNEGEQIQEHFAKFFRVKTKSELIEGAVRRGIMLQPICRPGEILEHPQLKARSYWQDLEYSHLGVKLRYPGRSCLPSETACKIWSRAPFIGEHNDEIYRQDLGYSKEDMVILKEAGVL